MDNDVKNILKQIIINHGTLICKKPNQLRSLLKDYCNGESKKEIMALMLVVEEGIAEEIIISKDKNIINRQIKFLCDSTPISDEIAQWAVMIWYHAFGIMKDGELSISIKEQNTNIIFKDKEIIKSGNNSSVIIDDVNMNKHINDKSEKHNIKKLINNTSTKNISYEKEYNQKQLISSSNSYDLPLETYYEGEIRRFSDADFFIIDKYISHSGKIVFDIFVKNTLSTGSYILINNTYRTSIVSIDSPVGSYKILKDGTIQIINKGIPLCRELDDYAIRDQIISIVVQGVADDYVFIKPMKLAKGTLL